MNVYLRMWLSQIEPECYLVTCFECVTNFKAQYTVGCKKKLCELHARVRNRFVTPVSRTSVANYACKFVNIFAQSQVATYANVHVCAYVGSAQSH